MISNKETDKPASEQQKTNFSIEHILNHAGSKTECTKMQEFASFSWLHCTRYCPPKLPRSQKKDGPQKRQLGRHPRIPFSSQQLSVLEEKFAQSPYLSSAEVTQLSKSLQLADIRVKIWFQNRRARERRERGDESQLKPYPHRTAREVKQMSHYNIEMNQMIAANLYQNKQSPPDTRQFQSIAYFLDESN